jgi:AraC-like DNA-binding protein
MNHNKKNDLRTFRGINLNAVRNRNELRVIAQLPRILNEYPDFEPNIIDIQDIYALSLNLLPAFYTQEFSIVLKKIIDDQHIGDALRKAIEIVKANPAHFPDNR